MFSVDELPALIVSSSIEMENRGNISRAQTPFRLRLICGEKSSLSVCELSGVLREKLFTLVGCGVAVEACVGGGGVAGVLMIVVVFGGMLWRCCTRTAG